MPRLCRILSAVPLAGVLLSCDTTNRPSAPLSQASNIPAFAASSSICEDRVVEVLDKTKSYTTDVRSVGQACRGGVQCAPEIATNIASFNSLANSQAGLLFACTPSSPEVCDGIDNDKDGTIDEDFPDKNSFCTAGVGVCLAGGVKICSANRSTTVCTAQPSSPSAERCDNLDNDCDSSIDEDFVDKGAFCVVGVGACMRAGFKLCNAAGDGTACNAQAGAPVVEICGDGIDNDCDGLTDEGCSTQY